MRRLWALLGLVLVAASPTVASAEGVIGGSAGSARLNGSDFADDGSNFGWKAFAGAYSQIFGVEAQYIDFGHPGDFGSRIHAYTAGLTGGWHFPMGIYPYAKVGAAFEDVKHKNVDEETDDYHRTNVFWGVGAQFPVAPHFGLRAEYERFQLRSEHEDLISAGAQFRF
ncbi:MAG TPA: porin family protein [Nevskiaceae bacterium]|nr:porin family protein [Nevskiaceae bacterium]